MLPPGVGRSGVRQETKHMALHLDTRNEAHAHHAPAAANVAMSSFAFMPAPTRIIDLQRAST